MVEERTGWAQRLVEDLSDQHSQISVEAVRDGEGGVVSVVIDLEASNVRLCLEPEVAKNLGGDLEAAANEATTLEVPA